MDKKKIIESNRKAWNEALPFHKKGRSVDLHKEFARKGCSVLDRIITAKLKNIGLKDKRVAQPCCNNGRELMSVINLGAKSGVGFDLSDAFIGEAEELRDISGLDCEFIAGDFLERGAEFKEEFDLVLITIGALCWIPDLGKFFKIVSGMLKPGGNLIMYEQHPFLYMLAMEGEEQYDPERSKEVKLSYFRTEPWAEADGLDYYGGEDYEGAISYSYTQKLSDILNPMVASGLKFVEMQEYPHDISNCFDNLRDDNLIPKCMIVHAVKE